MLYLTWLWSCTGAGRAQLNPPYRPCCLALQPVIVPFASTASESGLEHFTVQFKFDTYDVSWRGA